MWPTESFIMLRVGAFIMEEVDQSKVFFICKTCGFVFEADPYFFPIVCPQCGSEDTTRT
ncbi:hypothetical protein Mtc_0168 [Methanocella conradii HZ254]|uniref:Uncharacterized protein n=1 Tax=Methanocella conradii (strain DSM 24694 / JCM 17849 / CGMCC 1.5162 / HZ254) TaxID=1041930 RepID=H8I6P7_METCZ|nr:hypothetical protein Mtc_0168 [Methanocella conradii HZ254]